MDSSVVTKLYADQIYTMQCNAMHYLSTPLSPSLLLIVLLVKYDQYDPSTSGQNRFFILLQQNKKQVEKEAISSARVVHEGF